MESWEDQGIVLSLRPHGENGGVASLLTETHGRHCGYVHGARSTKYRGVLEPGTLVSAAWQARVSDNLGAFRLEQQRSYAVHAADDRLRLAALLSACALCETALPERESHPGLFHGLIAFFETLTGEVWGQAYVMWEIALLRELGFSLDLSRCAGGGDAATLAFVSPKTGRAVSYEKGAPYKDKLLPLPDFLRSSSFGFSPGAEGETEAQAGAQGEREKGQILAGLQLTGYFLEHWAFAHHTHGVPEARRILAARYER